MNSSVSNRQREILTILVTEYIRSGIPVSSDFIANKLPVSVSSATVRGEIADLEKSGYITRPHTSAGGLPSDRAYRLYVESLDNHMEPGEELRKTMRYKLRQTQTDMDGWTRVAVQVLAQLVQNIAVVTPPIASQSRWNYLQLVHIQDFLALMVIVMKGIRLKQQFILLENPTTQDELTQVSNKLNKHFGGLTRRQVAQKEVSLSPFENDVLQEAMLIFQREDQLGLADPYVGGLRHIFSDNDQPNGSQTRELTELFEDRLLLRSILSEIPEKGMVRVAIGGENKADLLHQSSVVFAQYGIPEEASGVLGVVGPTRMEYATAISHVRYLSSVMSELVSEAHGL